jgi:hypothetical protein
MPALMVVLTHGLHGTHDDYVYFEKSLRLSFSKRASELRQLSNVELYILRSKANNYKTHDGIKLMGTRLFDEVSSFLTTQVIPDYLKKCDIDPSLTASMPADSIYFTFIGHSLVISGFLLFFRVALLEDTLLNCCCLMI